MHPLVTNLSEFKDAELDSKIQNLTRMYFTARNPEMQNQIVMLLEEYKTELNSRRARAWNTEYQNRNKDLDNLINVN
jgi:hypothetical protein